MSDVDKQRNLAMAVAAVCAIGFAGIVGYVAGRGGESAPPAPQVGAPAATPVAGMTADLPASVAGSQPPAAVEREAPASEGEKNPSRRPAPRETRPRGANAPVAVGAAPATPAPPTAEPVAEVEPVRVPEGPESVAVAPAPIEIPMGTKIELLLEDPVSSQSSQVGESVAARLAAPIRVDGEIAVPSGTRVVGRVSEAKALAKIGGQARLAIEFESLEVAPEPDGIAAFWAREGKSETGRDSATIAAGAAIGTVLGNQAKKNDRGKVIGAIVGAGVGTAVAAATPGEAIELPAGARLELTLRQAVVVSPPG
jgi:hypothetical protein